MAAVLADLKRKAPRSRNTWLNIILVRLSGYRGLRVSEIAGLQISDVRVDASRPLTYARSPPSPLPLRGEGG